MMATCKITKGIPSKCFKVILKRTYCSASTTYSVSSEQLQFYRDNGYLVIKKLIDTPALDSYRERFTQVCNGSVTGSPGNLRLITEPTLAKQKYLKPEDYIHKVQELLHDEVFIKYGVNPRLLSVLSQFIGDDITAVHSMFINKPPGASRHPTHQDLYYFPFRPAEKIIGAWTAVDHVNIENGCLYAIPGSHKAQELYPHEGKTNALKLFYGVDEESIAPTDKRVHLKMSPGDTVFLHPLLLHGSGPNVSKNYRKAITFHFANSWCQYIDLKGTVQEHLAKEVEAITEKIGMGKISYIDVWRLKSKQVKGVKSNL